MAIIKQEVTENFFILSNMIMMDGSLAINERGLLVTLYSLPKTWDFSIRGMTKILPNGERAITTALRVCGENISQEVVKSRLLKLVFSDIKYVMTCLIQYFHNLP